MVIAMTILIVAQVRKTIADRVVIFFSLELSWHNVENEGFFKCGCSRHCTVFCGKSFSL